MSGPKFKPRQDLEHVPFGKLKFCIKLANFFVVTYCGNFEVRICFLLSKGFYLLMPPSEPFTQNGEYSSHRVAQQFDEHKS